MRIVGMAVRAAVTVTVAVLGRYETLSNDLGTGRGHWTRALASV